MRATRKLRPLSRTVLLTPALALKWRKSSRFYGAKAAFNGRADDLVDRAIEPVAPSRGTF
jgi:hypothetical protein